ncbi:MAG: hypothetical protein K9J74_10915, partial [Sulfuritalea sp.]|nr:hypothetical protein [Sulfuritalea sp.]
VADLGPEGGDGGGHTIATGTPEDVGRVKGSYTGRYLAQLLATRIVAKPSPKAKPKPASRSRKIAS